jgi:ESS family glutamate:Na+ symporter
MEYLVQGGDVLIVSIIVLFLGAFLTGKISFLKKYSIPDAVTGGLICSIVVALLFALADFKITFDTRLRDILLLVFFSTIGLSSKLRLLAAGGKALVILVVAATIFLVIQDVTGVLLVTALGGHPGYGLFGGSVSFAGGYGTAIAWGDVAEEAGLRNAKEIGIACATFGLIAGGILGGPIAERLIRRNQLSGPASHEGAETIMKDEDGSRRLNLNEILGSLLLLAACVELGDLVNRFLFSRGTTLPGFLTAMFAGIVLTNSADLLKFKVSQLAIDRCGELTLPLFLAMSLMSMQLWTLAQALGPILLILLAQITVMTLFAVFIIFRVMGRDYDASVIAAGFAGLGLGATPVGIANMDAVTRKYGPSPKAFLVIPLVGAFFIDIANAAVIKFFLASPFISQVSP